MFYETEWYSRTLSNFSIEIPVFNYSKRCIIDQNQPKDVDVEEQTSLTEQ